jgi:glc operon protein GlcG
VPNRVFNQQRRRGAALAIGLFLWHAIVGSGVTAALGQATGRSDIRDSADLFGDKAIAGAKRQIELIEQKYGVPVVIETIESLRGQPMDDVAVQHARQAAGHGVYVLASRRDHKLEVLVSSAFKTRIPEAKRLAIRNAFVEGFKEGDFDAGLQSGIQTISNTLAGEKVSVDLPETKPAPTPTAESVSSALVVRNQVRLTLAGARTILDAAEAKATDLGLKVNLAVVDDGGHMLAFERMDGARPASIYTATTKAVTAATFRAPSGPIPPGTTAPDPLLNLSLQNAALASGGKLTTLPGGIPVIVENQVIGAIGVGGGTSEQDTTVARAGVDAMLASLKRQADRPPETPADPK